ncbi:MAG TPA: pyruvate kinase alpha/beta domain-containing protein [Syntrophorhabdaceae bacterium]|nr:pyruvate kinase alpha/beta domain-containing protein [Syntrophorhabdaceae bacterium]
MEAKIVYFEDVKAENTEAVFELTQERLNAGGINKVVLASTTGATALKAIDFFEGSGVKLIVVPHQYDFVREVNPFPPDIVKRVKASGHEVHFGTMLFHTEGLYESNAPILMANLLRCFSQGTKVCFEMVMMVTDAGYLTKGEKVIAVAGTGRGADTALVMQASSSRNLKKLRVNEILCKPLNPWNTEETREKVSYLNVKS